MDKKIYSIGLSALFLISTAVLFNNCQAYEVLKPSTDGVNLRSVTAEDEAYFLSTLRPALQSQCAACHTENGIGPVSIYDWTNISNWIDLGLSDTNNNIFQKVNGIISHGGGDQCLEDNTSPCLEIRTLSLLRAPLKTEGIAGQVLEADSLGRMQAWIQDPALPDEILEAHVYIGAPVEAGGILVGTYTANEAIPDADYGDGHGFSFQLPEPNRDGTLQDLYIYGRIAEANNLIPLAPAKRSGFAANPLGREFYNDALLPLFTTCLDCHTDRNYDLDWFRLARPKPFEGAPDNNTFINGIVGNPNHADLNFCNGDLEQEPCLSVQAWWRLEFTPVAQ